MTAYGALFLDVAEEVLDDRELFRLRALLDNPTDLEELLSFDRSLGGPGMHNADHARERGYCIEDRDVFRPYQYCLMFFSESEGKLRWMTREIIHMCGLHLEELVERVARGRRLTLGRGLRNSAVERVLGPAALNRAARFLRAYNASKHDFAAVEVDEHGDPRDEEGADTMDGHLFTVSDAIVGYVVCRRLATPLYGHAGLKTPRSLWGPSAGQPRFPPVSET